MTSPLALLGGPPVITRPGPHFTWPPLTSATSDAVLAQLRAGISIYDRSGVIAELAPVTEAVKTVLASYLEATTPA